MNIPDEILKRIANPNDIAVTFTCDDSKEDIMKVLKLARNFRFTEEDWGLREKSFIGGGSGD